MTSGLVSAEDGLERQNEKLLKITEVLMKRVEQVTNDGGAAYEQFQRAVMLEDQVRSRTRDLEEALNLLNQSNSQLSDAMREAESSRKTLIEAIETVREGFGLFDGEDRLVLCNSRFGMFMPDIRDRLRPGLGFDDYIDLAARSKYMDHPEDTTPDEWAERRRARHREDHVVFNVAITGDRWVQVSEHRTTGRQTVILQTDVTDIMRIERRERSRILDNQSRIIAATLEHMEQGVAVFDRSGVLVGWNARIAELLTLPPAALRLGTNCVLLIDHLRKVAEVPDEAERLADWIALDRDRPPFVLELTLRQGVVLRASVRAMPDGGFVISLTDMTAERETERELLRAKEMLERRVLERTLDLEDALAAAERANASKSRFVAAASHDLLQPLSAAKLFVASLAERDRLPETEREAVLGKIASALEGVEDMIDSLLEMSRLETFRETFTISPLSLGDLLDRLDDEFQPLAKAKGVTLRILPTSFWVESDPSYLRRIVQNLIGNAIRYTAEGRVVVGARRRGSLVRIDVLDTGPGIPESMQGVIFDEFQRLGDRRSSGEGLGLGLTIVDRACGALGHPLTLASTVGRGSRFSVSVPRVRAEIGPVADGLPHRAPGFANTGRIVLVIDDDEEVRDALDYALTAKGHRVIACASAAEALDVVAETDLNVDFVILDFQLGRTTTALDVVGDLRAGLGDLPLRVLTAGRNQAALAACAAAGLAVSFKPADLDELDGEIRKAVPR